ncbi:MAG: hypothetical protein QNJ46_05155 [Leptolyngbyaceae cyanobacterium MO_188.B28]|nr:hypothetical protein [Leptolyngbyaceae cyanobacterium MO_188.B28]
MAGAIEQIERELAALDKATTQCDEEFTKLYTHYLEALGNAVKQQLILASYHLCTQAYPERFLKLSLAHRQKLQQAMRKLGVQAKTQLQLQQLQSAHYNLDVADTKARIQMLLSRRIDRGSKPDASEDNESEQLTDILAEATPPQKFSEAALEALAWISAEAPLSAAFSSDLSPEEAKAEEAKAEAEEAKDGDKSIPLPKETLTPSLIARQHLILEQKIREVLQTLSKKANSFLQQADILPALPESLLAAASESETIAEAPAGPPNLLNLFVEIGGEEDTEDEDAEESETVEPTAMTHLIAINLRLSEIEFADSTVSAWRSKIRSMLGKLKKLAQAYKKKQRERASAEAEAAWRASWHED